MLTIRCSMQDNGLKDARGREMTLEECREEFSCDEDGPECRNCPCLRYC